MKEENISQKLRLKNIDEINQNELMSKKQKNVSKVSNYIEHLHILVLLDVCPFLLLLI